MSSLSDTVCKRISRAASSLAYAGIEVCDFEQTAALKIIETEAKRPELAEQTDAYIAQCGIWAGRSLVKSEQVYSEHIVSMELEDDDDMRFVEIKAGDLSPEEQAIQEEVVHAIIEALKNLPAETTSIVKMLYLGYGEAEIARTLNISKSLVTQKKTKLRNLINRIL